MSAGDVGGSLDVPSSKASSSSRRRDHSDEGRERRRRLDEVMIAM